MNARFAERFQVCSGFVPVNMASGAPTSDWVSMKNYNRLTVLFFKGAGSAGDDPTITFNQAVGVTATSAKALAVKRIDKKQGTLASVGTYTKSTSDSAAPNDTFNTTNGTWTNSDLAEEQAIVLADIQGEDLDVDNGFDCVRAAVGDVGTNSQIGGLLYILSEPRYGGESLPSAIVD